MTMLKRLVLIGTLLCMTGYPAWANGPARNPKGESRLQVALQQGDGDTVMSLLTETDAAYAETFTRGTTPPPTPLSRQELDQAWGVLMSLLREHPRVPQLNFVIGMLAEKRRDLARAEFALERVLQISPDNHRAGLELARICERSGQHTAARRYYEHVLRQNPPENVARNIKAQLATLEHANKRLHISARVDAGAIRDDNVNVGPNNATIPISPLVVGSALFTELSVAPASQPVATDGAFMAGTIALLYDHGRPGGWGWTTDLNYYENWLDEPTHETRLLKGALGAKHAAKKSLFQGRLGAGRIWTGSDPLVDTISAVPAYLKIFNPGRPLHWISTALVEQRDYDNRNAYDGLYISLEQTLRLMLTDETSIFTGLRASHNDADDDIFSYDGLSCIAGSTVTYGRLRLYASARYTKNIYDTRETLAPEDREDSQWQFNTKATLRLLGHTGLELKYQHTDNASTFDLYAYERNMTMVGLWGRF